jgi:hypothetical protein
VRKSKYLAYIVLLSSATLLVNGTALARTAPNNTIEAERKDLCNTNSPINIYGATWVNGSSTASWSESLTVPWNATTVTAYMQSTAFMCNDAQAPNPRTNVRIQNLSANNGSGYIPISFNSGTTIQRGTMYRGEFSSTGSRAAGVPGILPITLNVTGLSSGSYTIRYTGVYADSRGVGLTATYYTTVNLIRQEQPKSATLSVFAGDRITINTGEVADFTARIESSDLLNVGTDKFKWRVTGIGSVTEQEAVIAGVNPRARPNYSTVFDNPGLYCRTIEITSAPTYVNYSPDRTSAEQCINVVRQPSYEPVTAKANTAGSVTDYEKGGVAPVFWHGVRIDSFPCDATSTEQWVNAQNWWAEPAAVNSIGSTFSGILEFRNCGGESGIAKQIRINNTTVIDDNNIDGVNNNIFIFSTYNLSGSDVNTINNAVSGSSYARQTRIGAKGPSVISFYVYSAPFTRFYGNDVRVCGDADTNRFVFDNRADNNDARTRGSWGAFASIFGTNNPTDLTNWQSMNGLRSSRINVNFPIALSTNWDTGLNCGPPAINGTGNNAISNITDATVIEPDEQTYFRVESGDITITRTQLITDSVITPFDPTTHPVVVIHAVAGNINIAPTVTRIDAVLIASGVINTCNTADRTQWQNNPPNGCNNPLVINGALMADTINFQRTWGSRFLAPPASTYTTSTKLNPGDLQNGQTAEVVNFPWYLHFITLPGLPNEAETRFDAYYSLPPRL